MSARDLLGQVPGLQAKGNGYRGTPGAGPAGMKCKDCAHFRRVAGGSRTFFKCGLVKPTGGPGTDIRMGIPACEFFERGQP
jgi:hypothetical protein